MSTEPKRKQLRAQLNLNDSDSRYFSSEETASGEEISRRPKQPTPQWVGDVGQQRNFPHEVVSLGNNSGNCCLNESKRLNELLHFEKEARNKGYAFIAGVDEAGRGPLAGPVVAAACIIPQDFLIPGVDDSKKLTQRKREELFFLFRSEPRISFGIGIIDSETIDRINILQATVLAMTSALANLSVQPDYLLVDGMELKVQGIPCQKIIKGDSRSYSIAAASIIAKVTRDELMQAYHERFPMYGFDQHKGYGTSQHIKALYNYGPCEIHRQSFEPVKGLCAS